MIPNKEKCHYLAIKTYKDYWGKQSEKYIALIVLIEKEVTRIDKTGDKNYKKYTLHITAFW